MRSIATRTSTRRSFFKPLRPPSPRREKKYGEEEEVIVINIDRQDGSITGSRNGVALDKEETETVGRIARKRQASHHSKGPRSRARRLHNEYDEQKGQLVTGVVQRLRRGAATVAAELRGHPAAQRADPRRNPSRQRAWRATVCEVRKHGSRVKVILSRTGPPWSSACSSRRFPRSPTA